MLRWCGDCLALVKTTCRRQPVYRRTTSWFVLQPWSLSTIMLLWHLFLIIIIIIIIITSLRQCTQITDGIVSRKAHKSRTSTWFSPGNYSQCLFPHRTVSQLNSDWSQVGRATSSSCHYDLCRGLTGPRWVKEGYLRVAGTKHHFGPEIPDGKPGVSLWSIGWSQEREWVAMITVPAVAHGATRHETLVVVCCGLPSRVCPDVCHTGGVKREVN